MKNTKIVKIDPQNIDYEILEEAAKIIRNGGLVIFPTETVYGLGANGFDGDACKKIFEAKGRPSDNPLILHISDISELDNIAKTITDNAKILAKNFWPGPLTMIFEKKDNINDVVTAGLDTVAVRYPQNIIAKELIRLSGCPIAAPSANTSGRPSPTDAMHVIEDMNGRVDMIIDGGQCSIGLESSVVDAVADVPMILRPGKVTSDDISKLLGKCEYDKAILTGDEKLKPRSPGQKYRHYSPKAELVLYKGDIEKVKNEINLRAKEFYAQGKKTAILASSATKDFYEFGEVINLGDRNQPDTIAHNLFYALRQCDDIKADIILSESFDDRGIGNAIMNRLSKAASKKIDI